MGVTVSDPGGGDFVPAPEGTHVARCVQVIDLGTQTSSYYKNDDGSPQKSKKVLIGWEIPGELNDKGEPFLVWHRYTQSLHEKANLRIHLQSWRGRKFTDDELKGFLLSNILDKPCLLNIVHNDSGDKTFANVSAVMALPKGQECPDRVHKLIDFDINNFDRDLFEEFSDNLKKTINNSDERKGIEYAEPPPPEENDDEVPF